MRDRGVWGLGAEEGEGEGGEVYDNLGVIDVGSAAGDSIDAVGEVDNLRVTFHQGRGFAVRADIEDGAGGSGSRSEEGGGEGGGFHVCWF